MKSQTDGRMAALLLAIANILIPLAILAFATGFFPYKPFLPGLAEFESLSFGSPPAAPFDRVVFMVVDALRSDFVYLPNSGFHFTQSLIQDGRAIPFTAHATSPTITMPRIKAITTGSIPSFLDVILNFDEGDTTSTLAAQDTWLAQMKAKGSGKLVMFGDDTWLKLFPDTFDRADGTSSFFVSDFTEVDNNVTRHITEELGNDDWNTMVLHYLGLDHIGHKAGPRSPNMLPKQREMDSVVKEIFEAIESRAHLESTLIVLCGDHGMNDAGNHGASSPGETSPALVFMSPKLKELQSKLKAPAEYDEDFQYYSTIEQSDLAPTLAALLGFPVPKNNLGALIVDFLPFWTNKSDQVQILMRNANQILGIVKASFGSDLFDLSSGVDACSDRATEIRELACDWHRVAGRASNAQKDGNADPQWISDMSRWLRNAQKVMSSMASNYDMSRLGTGQAIAAGSLGLALVATVLSTSDSFRPFIPFGIITIAYGIMMFASSYVEEEQHFWYWSTTAWLAYLGSKNANKIRVHASFYLGAVVLTLLATRVIRVWNQTGQKFAGDPDIVKMYLLPNPILLWILVTLTYLWVHRALVVGFDRLPLPLSVAGTTGIILAAFTFKLAFTKEDSPELVVDFAQPIVNITKGASLVTRARAVFIGVGLATACLVYFMWTKRKASHKSSAIETLHHLCTLLGMTQSRVTNIPLFALNHFVYRYLAALDLGPTELATSSVLLQYLAFFAFGGSNSIASVDLSSAYNGVSGYNVVAVGVLTFAGNWAGPVFWTSATNLLLVRRAQRAGWGRGRGRDWGRGRGRVFLEHTAVLTVFTAASMASVMAACTILRTHLFIWTVFSPKYLYVMAWSLAQHLIVNIGLGGVLFWLGTL